MKKEHFNKNKTHGRGKEGETEIYLLKTMLQNPATAWKTSDFFIYAKKHDLANLVKIGNRWGTRKRLLSLWRAGLVDHNKNGHNSVYTLPKDYLSVGYLGKIVDTFGSILYSEIMKLFPRELRYQYLLILVGKKSDLSKLSKRRRDELLYESAKRSFLSILFMKDQWKTETLKNSFNLIGDLLNNLTKSESKKMRYKAEALLEVRDIYNEVKRDV